jgi:uncharacterized protein YggT (Ycf19 family)
MSFYIRDLDKWISYYEWLILSRVVTLVLFALAVAWFIDGVFNGNVNQNLQRLTDPVEQTIRKVGSYSELIDTVGFIAVYALSVYFMFQMR